MLLANTYLLTYSLTIQLLTSRCRQTHQSKANRGLSRVSPLPEIFPWTEVFCLEQIASGKKIKVEIFQLFLFLQAEKFQEVETRP